MFICVIDAMKLDVFDLIDEGEKGGVRIVSAWKWLLAN